MVRIARMALSKAGLELGAVAALAAVMLGGFYYQGTRVDASEERLSASISNESAQLGARIDGVNQRIDSLDERLNKRIDDLDEHIDDLDERLNKRIDDLDERLNKRIDDLDERLDGRIDGLDRRIARIEGLMEAWASTQSPKESADGALG